MSTINVYARLKPEELREIADRAISMAETFLAANPDRENCNISVWYGRVITVLRGAVREDVEGELARLDAKGGAL